MHRCAILARKISQTHQTLTTARGKIFNVWRSAGFNLLYRRIDSARSPKAAGAACYRAPADSKSATQQIEICATSRPVRLRQRRFSAKLQRRPLLLLSRLPEGHLTQQGVARYCIDRTLQIP